MAIPICPSVEGERRLNTFPVRLGLGENPPTLLFVQQVDLEILIERRKTSRECQIFLQLRLSNGHCLRTKPQRGLYFICPVKKSIPHNRQ